MTEDDIPIPCVEDELVVKFGEVNDKLEAVVTGIMDVLDKIESQCVELDFYIRGNKNYIFYIKLQ